MKIAQYRWNETSKEQRDYLMRRSESDISQITEIVKPIIEAVHQRGDEALREYALKLDGAKVEGSLRATEEDFTRARASLEPRVIEAIERCAANVKHFHQTQLDREHKRWMVEIEPGVFGGEQINPIPSVGIYVPRGKGAFPSVMYMLCAPAVVAGVPDIAVCTPPRADGSLDDASLVAAQVCGVKNVYKAGGAQAVAALAFGTETVPKVCKMVGPGNPYVAAARRLLASVMDGGMPAGPSEALILADETAHPHNTALDMLNEAEHGPDSASILVTHSQTLADEVAQRLPALIASLPEPRREFCQTVFEKYGGIVVTESLEQSIAFANEYAVEHLLLKVNHPDEVLPQLKNVGEILVGETTPIVLGNFGIGINAVLPTGRHARVYSCTSIWDFMKRTSLSYVSEEGYKSLREDVITLADYEGFPAHAEVLRQRQEVKSTVPRFVKKA